MRKSVAANRELGEKGLRVLSFAIRNFENDTFPTDAEPMDLVADLAFIALVGIIDPLRPSAKEAVRIAHDAGIDVRMITGDHAVTAKAIASRRAGNAIMRSEKRMMAAPTQPWT